MANEPTQTQNQNKPNEPNKTEPVKTGTDNVQTSPATSSGGAEGSAPSPDTAGTSRQAHDNRQQNNQMLNPDVENAAGNAAAPGVVPTNQVNQPPAPTNLDAANAGQEPKPHTANPNEKPDGEYTLRVGKHRYTDPKTGERVTARPGDSVPLSKRQYESMQDRFTPNKK